MEVSPKGETIIDFGQNLAGVLRVKVDLPAGTKLIYEKEHIEIMRRLAPECMVLLKSNGDFPLAAPEKVALYGSGARRTILGKR